MPIYIIKNASTKAVPFSEHGRKPVDSVEPIAVGIRSPFYSMQTNAFDLIFVSPVRSRDSDSTDYLYSPCSTVSVYHLFISVIKRLSCCGSRGNFPGIVTDFVFWRVAETCLPA